MKNITVIGVGKLGLGFALLLEKVGYNVLGIDVIQPYIDSLNAKTFTSSEPKYNELLQQSKNFRVSSSIEEGLHFSDIIFIIVQTPNSGGEKFYDHSILSNVLVKINAIKPEKKDIIIGCTVMPKYIDEIGRPLLSDCNNCFLSYNPEFVAQGDIIKGFENPDIVLVGTNNPLLRDKLEPIYNRMTTQPAKMCFLTPLEAEVVKIGLNSFITTKLSFANMVSDFCDTVGADKTRVLDSIGSDSRIGNKYFKPGYSFGGPCFPRDTRAFKQLMDQHCIDSALLEATTHYNNAHVGFQTRQILSQPKDEYVFEGVCYKDNSSIPIIDESAKLKIAKEIAKLGLKVVILDTQEIIMEVKKEFGTLFEYRVKT